MNSLFKRLALAALLAFGCLAAARAETSSVNTPGSLDAADLTSARLRLLERAGLLEASDTTAPLTRRGVAEKVLKARSKYETLVVAMNAAEVPPPPEDDKSLPTVGGSDAAVGATGDAGTADALEEIHEPSIEEAAASLHSLEEAYASEIKTLKERVRALKDRVDTLEAKQWADRKKVKSLQYAPKVAILGLGRGNASSRQFSGNAAPTPKADRSTNAFLDLCPTGTVSKNLFWDTCLRLQSALLPSSDAQVSVRRISVQFNPPWFSLWMGDFEESYTPLVMWNRDNLDLAFAPEMMARRDRQMKYESLLDHAPNWPFRGVKIGTKAMWDDPKIVESVSASAMAHMIRNGFDEGANSTKWYFGPHQWMEWIFAGQFGVRSAKIWWGEKYLRLSVDGYGTLLNQLRGTDTPGSSYGYHDPDTWAHGYRVGSVRPDLSMTWGNGRSVGAAAEFAFAKYLDDERDASGKTVSDYALRGGPYVRFGDSRVSLFYHDVGPYYYAPLAQTRQDAVTSTSALSYANGPDPYQLPLRGQDFLTGLSRPGGLFTYYDRTADNVFPYGLATPNRRGFGGDIDLAESSLRLKASAYWLEEIAGNLTFNATQTAFVPVDDPDGTIGTPKRKFVYANVGPSWDLGPSLHLNRLVEVGANARFERTDSSIGRLESLWTLGSLRVGILKPWEVTLAAFQRKSYGTEAGMDGTLWARYSYLYDNTDLGRYGAVTVDRRVRSVRLSQDLKLNDHADLFLDWAWTETRDFGSALSASRLCGQFAGLTYEVRF